MIWFCHPKPRWVGRINKSKFGVGMGSAAQQKTDNKKKFLELKRELQVQVWFRGLFEMGILTTKEGSMAIPAVLRLAQWHEPQPSEPWYPPAYTGATPVPLSKSPKAACFWSDSEVSLEWEFSRQKKGAWPSRPCRDWLNGTNPTHPNHGIHRHTQARRLCPSQRVQKLSAFGMKGCEVAGSNLIVSVSAPSHPGSARSSPAGSVGGFSMEDFGNP